MITAWNYDAYLVVQGDGAPKRYEVRWRLQEAHRRRQHIAGHLIFPQRMTAEQVDAVSRRLVRFLAHRTGEEIVYLSEARVLAIQRARDAHDWAMEAQLRGY